MKNATLVYDEAANEFYLVVGKKTQRLTSLDIYSLGRGMVKHFAEIAKSELVKKLQEGKIDFSECANAIFEDTAVPSNVPQFATMKFAVKYEK